MRQIEDTRGVENDGDGALVERTCYGDYLYVSRCFLVRNRCCLAVHSLHIVCVSDSKEVQLRCIAFITIFSHLSVCLSDHPPSALLIHCLLHFQVLLIIFECFFCIFYFKMVVGGL